MIKEKSCLICQSRELVEFLTSIDFRYAEKTRGKKFFLYRCLGCKTLFVNPRPSMREMGAYYPTPYYKPVFNGLTNIVVDKIMLFYRQRACDWFSKYRRTGELLDVGCGTGDFLVEAKRRGFLVQGIDISSEACRQAEKKGLRVQRRDLKRGVFGNNVFDVVTMWHVLEHLHNPVEALKTVRKILRKDGILILEVPNIESFSFKLFRSYYFHLDLPRHLFHWSLDSLAFVLKEGGFKIVTVDYPRFNSILSLFRSFSRWLSEKKMTGWRFWLGSLLIYPGLAFLTLVRLMMPKSKGDILRLVAKKGK